MIENPLIEEAVRLIIAASVQKTPERPATKEKQNEQIRELFDLGYSRTEISHRLHMDRETVTNRLRRMELG